MKTLSNFEYDFGAFHKTNLYIQTRKLYNLRRKARIPTQMSHIQVLNS